ncbi:arginine--tRNA ligase, cytoplasmic isoform X1 [Penaeus vannamei]|uniref:Probable arginine--tRNA ligase, cytoplasmic n=1 Tax=Penaeus vannamei TaxID=6689 RepID=A0A423SGK5_PENVA|nr:arginine--tRNA ligase, cytoplasmic-like isoform X1 [Penaeus vannamei]ROT63322.1 putative arginine--tRNA ligase, cytoplasmic [Penaeus vannamei]
MTDARVCDYILRCAKAEKETQKLTERLQALVTGSLDCLENEDVNDKEFLNLLNENKKLKYRINILKKSIEAAGGDAGSSNTDDFGSHMCNIMGQLEKIFTKAVLSAYPEAVSPMIQIQLSKHADYQCNAAMSLAKSLKKNPREVGQQVLKNVAPNPLISNLELSGPGFINIVLSKDFIRQQVTNLILTGVTPPPATPVQVVVDFSSPNIAKEMHVGHLRSTIIGDSIARLLEFLGHKVLRLNHLGDWGTQFGMLIAHLQDTFPNFATEPPPIADLQKFYKESKKRFDEDEEFKKRAYEAVVKLQAYEPLHKKGWEEICEISRKEFMKVYERLQIRIIDRGESFYQERMVKLVKELNDAGLLEEDDGRKVMFGEGTDVPLTVVKSDGGFTYDTSDMACLKHRIDEEKADWIVYVTDAGQSQHFKSFLACAKKAGFYNDVKTRVDHVTFGVVLGEDKKKFKTRSGDTVRLIDLLNEGLQRSEEKLKEKDRHTVLSPEEFEKARDAVAYGCIKYADLCHDRSRDYIFSFDRMLDFRGNTAAYLLYALTRIRSIIRTAGVKPEEIEAEAKKGAIALEHEKEWKLARTILKLPDVLVQITQDLYLHPLCEFLYEVSTVFTEFYDNCYCVEKDQSGNIVKINMNRILLCEATAQIMEKCFSILGITTVGKM